MEKCGEAAFSNAVKRRFQVTGKLRLASFGPEKAGRRKLPPLRGAILPDARDVQRRIAI